MKRVRVKSSIPDFDQMLAGIRRHRNMERKFNEAIGHVPSMTSDQYYVVRLTQLWVRPVIIICIGLMLVMLKSCS